MYPRVAYRPRKMRVRFEGNIRIAPSTRVVLGLNKCFQPHCGLEYYVQQPYDNMTLFT